MSNDQQNQVFGSKDVPDVQSDACIMCGTARIISGSGGAAAGNLAQGKTISASSVGDVYVAAHANDGNQGTYWESAGNAFPQWIKVDLGASSSVNQVVLKLPAGWEARTQTLSVQGSTDDASYSNLAAFAGYVFNPSSGSNTVTIPFTAATARYIKNKLHGQHRLACCAAVGD
ncbi:discoidin domain-containing protein [Paenibacillus rhizoplanae]